MDSVLFLYPFIVYYVAVDSASGGGATGKAPQWKKLKAGDLGISTSKISRPARVVLNGLKRRGLLMIQLLHFVFCLIRIAPW